MWTTKPGPTSGPTRPPTWSPTETPPSQTSVLALNHYTVRDPDFRYVPQVLVVDFDGNVDYDVDFTFGEDTIAEGACATTLNGEQWVFGGSGPENTHRQVRGGLSQSLSLRLRQ